MIDEVDGDLLSDNGGERAMTEETRKGWGVEIAVGDAASFIVRRDAQIDTECDGNQSRWNIYG